MASPVAPPDRSWLVSIHTSPGHSRPVGAGVVIDGRRVLTCRHVVSGRDAGGLWVELRAVEDPFLPPVPVASVRAAEHPEADAAVLELGRELPPGVTPVRLLRPREDDLVGGSWWAYGFADRIGNEADGAVAARLTSGWVRLDCDSRYRVEKGFSGGGLWSPDYEAVVGLVGQAQAAGDGRCLTMRAIVLALPDENLEALTDGWSIESAGPDAVAAWGWALAADDEGRRHWRPRSRGVTSESERGHRFRGRRVALTEIAEWLEREEPDREVLVVTGSPGVGKSAVLGRVVTTADAGIAAALPADDDAVRAPVGSVACAVHAKGKTALEVAAEIARAASAPLPERVDDAVEGLRGTLAEHRGRRFAVVVDALDEASSAAEARSIVRHLLVPLAETCADVGARVVAGTRRQDDEGDLVAAFGPARRELDLDRPRYFARSDLVAYAEATLQLRGAERPGNPYADPAAAKPLAERIADVASANFLVAGLIARTHGLHDRQAARPDEIGAIPASQDPVAVALRGYLDRVAGVAGLTAAQVLTALAHAEGTGLPPELWSIAVRAVTDVPVDERDLVVFATGAAANFLVEDAGAGAPSYRLFHHALGEALVAARAERQQAAHDQRSITHAFLALGRRRGWEHVPAYLLRSLGHHAAAAHDVDALLDEPAFLLHADLRRLIPLAAAASTPTGRERARLLRRTPEAIGASAADRLALFSVTEAIDDLGSGFRRLRQPAPYRGRWALARQGSELAVLTGHSARVWGVCAARAGDRDLLASAGSDRTVRLWDPATGEPVRVLTGHTGGVRGVCAVRGGGRDLLASGGDDGTVRLWDAATGEPVHTFAAGAAVWAVCAVPAGGRDLLAAAGDDGAVRLWDPAPGELRHTLAGHTGKVRGVCAVRAGHRHLLASSSNDGSVRLWDPATGAHRRTLTGHNRGVRGVCAVPAGERELLASASNDRSVRLWDPDTGEPAGGPGRGLTGQTGAVGDVCGVPSGQGWLLASAGNDRSVRVWDPDTGEPLHVLTGHTGAVRGVCALRLGDRTLLASAGLDRSVRLWDAATGEPLTGFTGGAGGFWGMCAVRAGERELLATAGNDHAVRLWEPVAGEPVRVLTGHTDGVRSVCSVPTGSRALLASAGDDKTVRLWDPVTGELVHTRTGGSGGVWDVCAVRAGGHDLLASGGADQTVRLWDPATGDLVHTLTGHTGAVRGVCAVRTGGRDLLASAGADHTVRLWDPVTGRAELRAPVRHVALGVASLGSERLAVGLRTGLLVLDLAAPPPADAEP